MSDPRRLLEDEASDFEGALLRSARGDAPEPGNRARLLASLGIAGGITGASATVGAAAVGAHAGIAPAASWGALAVAKWLAVGLVGGGLALGGAAAVRSANAPEASRARVGYAAVVVEASKGARARVEATRAEEARLEAARIDEAAAAKLDAPAPDDRAPAPRARVAVQEAAPPSAPEPDALAGELAVLDRARAALASKDPNAALEALGDHDQRFASGALSPEAIVLRIEALATAGRDSEAARLGERFLAEHPGSPHARRVRSVLARAKDPSAGAPVPAEK